MVGFGASIREGRGRDISVGRQADYLKAWLGALGVRQAVLSGHDLGGSVVQIAAVRNPQQALGRFLANSIGYDSWPIPAIKAMRVMGGILEHFPAGIFRFVYSSILRPGPALTRRWWSGTRSSSGVARRATW